MERLNFNFFVSYFWRQKHGLLGSQRTWANGKFTHTVLLLIDAVNNYLMGSHLRIN